MLPAAFALGASLAWGFGDFLGGLKARVLGALSVMALSQPFGLVALAIAVVVRGTGPPGWNVAWACLSAAFAWATADRPSRRRSARESAPSGG